MRRLLRPLLFLCLLSTAALAAAQTSWPSQPIRLVMSGAPGTPPDVVGRLFASALGDSLGTPVVVENKTGIGSVIAMAEVHRSPADGHTLLYAVNNVFSVNPLVSMGTPDARPDFVRQPLDAFKPVGTTLQQGLVLIATKGFPAEDFAALVAHVKGHPGQVNYGSYGAGSLPHLAMEMVAERNGLDMAHIPYKGGALTDLIAGHISLLIEPVGTALPHIQAGAVKALAYTGTQRHRSLPDVPTLGELGSGEPVFGWHAIWVRADTPPAIAERLAAELRKAAATPQVQQRLQDLGYDPLTSEPDAIVNRMTAEAGGWAKLVQDRNINLTQ
ncbi:Bug family tripartite tricarboxylate transporter substrate binding protein [Verticiella sediminum]|nr:tripartite tricarboxylate transporter substrate binding protein [Verticiella sediminum]